MIELIKADRTSGYRFIAVMGQRRIGLTRTGQGWRANMISRNSPATGHGLTKQLAVADCIRNTKGD